MAGRGISEEEEEAAVGEGTAEKFCALGTMLVILTLIVLTCTLLQQTWGVRDACDPMLWWVLLARMIIIACAILGQCFVWTDVEPILRARMDLPPLAPHDAGGLSLLCFGNAPQMLWVGRILNWGAHAFFVIALAISLAHSTERGSACTNALAGASFTNDGSLLGFAWMFFALDALVLIGSSVSMLTMVMASQPQQAAWRDGATAYDDAA